MAMNVLLKMIIAAAITLVVLPWNSFAAERIDRKGSKASSEAPVSTQVEVLEIPENPDLPKYVIIMGAFKNVSSGSNITSGTGAPTAPEAVLRTRSYRRQSDNGIYVRTDTETGLTDGSIDGQPTVTHEEPNDAIAERTMAQFRTAFTHWKNIAIVDNASVIHKSDGSLSVKMNDGEIGPFIIRGYVTEFNETADLTQKNTSINTGPGANLVTMVAPRSLLGPVLHLVGPKVESAKQVRQGAVAVDIEVIDGRTNRVIGFTCNGKFESQSAINGLEILGCGGGTADFAASTIGQATRAAANDALMKLRSILQTVIS